MCGIYAVFARRGRVSPEAIDRATGVLRHRGPDSSRKWISPGGQVGLGHTRLSIIDLRTGEQPIASANERIHIVVNGELYDFERTQRELEQRGHRLRTRSDSEILLHLYEDAGTRCVQALRGEYAWALWDEDNAVLFAGRDRFGIKPLYYAFVGDTLHLASEVKALFAAGVPAAWDHESVHHMTQIHLGQDRTPFRGVYQIPPGHYLLATREHFQLVRYWDFDFPKIGASPAQRTEAEHVEAVRHALEESVRLRLRADVPVGCFLSGGIDSSAVIGIAAQHRSTPIDAFTIAFDEDALNEVELARETARHVGAKFYELAITEDMVAESFADFVWHAELFINNANGVAKFLLSKMVRDHGYKVMLTGEGADEIFAGYQHFRRDMVLHQGVAQDEETKRRLLDKLGGLSVIFGKEALPDAPSLDALRATLGFVPSWLEGRANAAARYQRLFAPAFREEFARRDAYRMLLDSLDFTGQMQGREPLHQSMYLWAKAVFPNAMLSTTGDRVEMAHSVEGRLPYLDHHLVELARDLPLTMKINGDTEKYVLREAVKPYVTPAAYARKKHAFHAPAYMSRVDGRFNQLTQDILRSRVLESVPFFDRARIVALLDQLPSLPDAERAQWTSTFINIMCACVFQERFGLAA